MPTGARKWKARWKLGSSPCLSIPPSLSLTRLLLPTCTHWKTWPATGSKYPDTWRNTGFLFWLHSRVLGSARYSSWPILAQQLALGLDCVLMTAPPGGVIIREDSTAVQGHNPTQGCLSSLPQFPGRLGSSLPCASPSSRSSRQWRLNTWLTSPQMSQAASKFVKVVVFLLGCV